MERVAMALRQTLGREHVLEIPPLTGSEDFGRFRDGDPPVALCYLRLGVDPPGTERDGMPYLHSPRFAPPPEAIAVGLIALTVSALGLFESDHGRTG
jgi:hippurate hydrolase